ncbi:phosphopantetheine-binding protein [Dactylosporangium sp. CA-139114]|uniref:acyl carrier protein n=1 Tax=Dactylosporangium sp. CA-139114 TaxID=3239931 RepID=UPI003D951308
MHEQRSRSFLSRMGQRLRATADPDPSPEGDAATRSPDTGALARDLAAKPPAEQEQVLLDTVRETVAELMGLGSADAVAPEALFAELGVDSLVAFALRARLTEVTGLRLSATLVFDHPTPAAVAEFLRGELAEGATPSLQPLFAELDVLEGMFAVAVLDAESRARAQRRLRELLHGISETPPEPAEQHRPDLAEASDDEVFDFIGKEFGIH